MWTTSLQSLTRSNTAWTRCKRWTNKDKCCAEKWNNGNYSRGHSRQRDKPARVLRQFWGCGFKVYKPPMLLFWIIRLFWKPLHFFILFFTKLIAAFFYSSFFYQTNSKSLRSAWKRSFDVLIKKYTNLQILFYLNFWSEKKKQQQQQLWHKHSFKLVKTFMFSRSFCTSTYRGGKEPQQSSLVPIQCKLTIFN